MELTELARAVLLGSRLDDKLVAPDGAGLTDDRPGSPLAQPPSAPARPPGLALDSGRPRVRFPGPGQLHDPTARGRALHFFANHELLAMELMALVLLRFPQAPAAFRRGVAHTLLEEQSHLRRYRDRMHALGVELGDVPVSDFFWATMADMASPLDYVVRMSMTFEQANLDHARHYAALFRAVDDGETADLMDLIYEEEIGHVRHGVQWFNRWRTEAPDRRDETDWDAYRRLLPSPLSPRRAKGSPYVIDARRRVGLSETFAAELEIYSQSRGRPPVVWLFEPDFEAQEQARALGRRPRATATAAAIQQDLAPVMMYLAASDDVVVAPTRPSTPILSALTRAGFEVPELLAAPTPDAAAALGDRGVSGVEGWATSAAVDGLRAQLDLPRRARPSPDVSSKLWAAERLEALLAAQPKWAELAGPPEVVGRRCESPDDVRAAQRRATAAGFSALILKRPFSTSGQARLRIAVDGALPERWLARAFADGPILAEPWLDKVADLSVLLEVTDRDLESDERYRPRVASMPFITGAHGVYRGHLLAEPTFGWPEQLEKRVAFGADGGVAGRLAGLAAYVRRHLAAAGHRGPAAIDLLVYRPPGAKGPEDWALKPIVEINARRTMAHVAYALKQHLAPGRIGAWLHRPTKPDDATKVARWPAIETRRSGRRRQLLGGVIATTDPGRSKRVWSFLAVGRTLEDLRQQVSRDLDEDAARPLALGSGR